MSILQTYLFVIILSFVVCVFDWRKGLLVSILMGFLQDPVRKLIPDTPIYLTVLVVICLGMTYLGTIVRGLRIRLAPLLQFDRGLALPLYGFMALVILQSIVAVVRTGSPVVGLIGVLAYLTPVPCILLGYYFARTQRDITKVLAFYAIAAMMMASGIFLSYLGVEWRVLDPVGPVGERLYAFSPSGDFLRLYCGFFRAPEIAAWHSAASVCLLVVVFLSSKRKNELTVLVALCIGILVVCILLTGRRKVLAEIFLFLAMYGFLLNLFSKGALRFVFALLLCFAVSAFVFLGDFASDQFKETIRPYYERGATVRTDAPDRMYDMTIGDFRWIISVNGFFGSGAGTGSQGAQHFGVDMSGAEGGLGKVLAELGVPGVILFLWFVVALVHYVWKVIVNVSRKSRDEARVVCGLVAFLAANSLIYVVAHQVFGDLFVLSMIGLVTGFALAAPKLQTARRPVQQGSVAARPILPGTIAS